MADESDSVDIGFEYENDASGLRRTGRIGMEYRVGRRFGSSCRVKAAKLGSGGIRDPARMLELLCIFLERSVSQDDAKSATLR